MSRFTIFYAFLLINLRLDPQDHELPAELARPESRNMDGLHHPDSLHLPNQSNQRDFVHHLKSKNITSARLDDHARLTSTTL